MILKIINAIFLFLSSRKRVLVLFLISHNFFAGFGLNNWFQVNSKCFQANSQTGTHPNAVLTCQKSDASLYSVKDQNELNSLSKILNTNSQYWTTAKFNGKSK